MYTAAVDIDELIREDVPYFDLTGFALGLDIQKTSIECFTREKCIVCGTEEAAEVFERLHIEVRSMIPSGNEADPGAVLIKGSGKANAVLTSWKVIQNLIDHTSGIATKTRKLVELARAVSPEISILTTRKMFPGTKALAIKAVMAGGAFPHRLGTSETLLVFPQHMNILGGHDEFIRSIPDIKKKCCEKPLLAETSDLNEAMAFLEAGADGIQFEKLSAQDLTAYCKEIRTRFPHAILLGAGGINASNVQEYAKSGADGLVTTSLYSAPPVDVGVRIKQEED